MSRLLVTFDLDTAMTGKGFPYRWDDGYGARVGLLPKGGDPADVRWFEVGPCYVFHPLNAFDDGTRVVLDVVRHPKMFAHDTRGPNDGAPVLWRWTIDTALKINIVKAYSVHRISCVSSTPVRR